MKQRHKNYEKVFKRHGIWNEKFYHPCNWNYKVWGMVEIVKDSMAENFLKLKKDNDL